MKKVFVILFFALFFLGCSAEQKPESMDNALSLDFFYNRNNVWSLSFKPNYKQWSNVSLNRKYKWFSEWFRFDDWKTYQDSVFGETSRSTYLRWHKDRWFVANYERLLALQKKEKDRSVIYPFPMSGEIFVCKSGSLYMWSDLLPDKDVPLHCRLENYVSSPLSDPYFEKIPIDNFSTIEKYLNDSTVASHAFASYVFQLNKWIYGNEKVHDGMSWGDTPKEYHDRKKK